MIGTTKLKSGGNFSPFPSGKYTLQLMDVNPCTDTYKGEEKPGIRFTYAVLDDIKFKDDDGVETSTRGRLVWERTSDSIGTQSNMYKMIKVIDPKIAELTDKQRESYNLDALIGSQVMALVSKDLNKAGDRYFNNPQTYEKCENKLTPLDTAPTAPGTVVSTQPVTVPVEAPEEETADGFMNALKAEEASEVSEEDAEQKALEAKLAALKAKKEAGKK